jgi:hypothetical protein
MPNPTTDWTTRSATTPRTQSQSPAYGAARRRIDCGTGPDGEDAADRARYADRPDARRAFDATGGMYADQPQAI